jgi:streptogramin lyase
VSPQGQPAYVSTTDRIYRKENGQFKLMQGCSTGVAIGPDGTIFRRDCEYYVHKFVGEDWVQLGDKKVERIAVDSDGTLWIRDNTYQIFRFDGKTFVQVGAGFNKFALTTGPDN